LRKGAYLPRFVSAPAEEVVKATSAVPVLSPVELPVAQPQPPRSWGRGRNLTVGFAAGAVAMFGALAIWSAVANPGMRVPATRLATEVTPSGWTPELEALWRPFLGKKAPLLIAFETRFFVEMGPLVVRDFRVNNIGTVESSDAMMRVQRLFGVHQLYPSGDYTDVGTPVAMFYLTRLLSSRIPAIAVKSLHQMAASDFRDNNLILVGKPWMDPQIERVLAGASLVDARGKIVNVHPAPGEPAEYKDVNDRSDPDGWSEKYSVITLMPSPAGGHRILTLTGSGSENPGALAYYLTNPETVKDLYRRLYPGTAGSPEYFQILVKAQFKAKALVRVDYVTHRALKTY
jgi:hypothetical protein